MYKRQRQYIAVHFSQEEADAALVYEDEGFSGGNLERPQFKKMMKDSQKTKFAAIVVYRLDRISRNIGDFAKLIEDLGDRHIDFISIREQFDTSSPMGRAMMYIASVFSQLERETIAERIRDNMHELSKTGRWLGGTTPTGYESESISNVTVDGKVRKACKLKIIPEEISLVQLIFEKFLETGSLTKVDAFLLEKRYTTKRGKNFTRFAIKGILTNPVYMIADLSLIHIWKQFKDMELDLQSIWMRQSVPEILTSVLEQISEQVFYKITDPNRPTINVTPVSYTHLIKAADPFLLKKSTQAMDLSLIHI